MDGEPQLPQPGTVRSWMRDGFLTCLTAPSAILLGGTAAGGAFGAISPLREVLHYVPMLLGLGGASGLTLGVSTGFIGHQVCSRSPRKAALGGVLAGALGAVALGRLSGASVASDFLTTAGAGAALIGPPWVAYVAVRSRGRSGLALLPVTWLWVALLGASAVTWEIVN